MIKRKEFESGTFKKRIFRRRENHPIAKLLRNHTNYAFKAKEIARKVKMNENTVRSMLANLIRDGLVVHKVPYFAWKK